MDTGNRRNTTNRSFRWIDVLASALAAVGWAYLGMTAVAYAALDLLDADAVGELGPMTAAAVVLAVGGRVTPSGDMAAFGVEKSAADAAIDVSPLGVSLVGALLLGWLFTRSLRQAGAFVGRGELAARAAAVAALFTGTLGGLAWAGSGKVTIDGADLPLPDAPGLGGPFGDAIGDMADAETAVGFEVDVLPSLLGGLGWAAAVLLVALASARYSPLPRGWESLHRTVRPAASAVRTVAVLAVAAALAGAGYVAATEDHSARIAGGALAGAPNGAWLALPLGLFVRWHGSATGQLAAALPDPLDDLMSDEDKPLTVGRLAELDGRVWLLAVATAMLMLTAGVLTAVRTPARGERTRAFALRCGLRLGAVTAVTLPLLGWLTGISADASMSMFGVDAVGGGVELHGSPAWALALGAAWGAGAGTAGALLARAASAAGGRASPLARGASFVGTGGLHADVRTYPGAAYEPGPYNPAPAYHPPDEQPNPYTRDPTDPALSNAPTETHTKPTRPQPPPPGPPPPGSPRYRDPHD